jgi:hypothetical protein
LKAATNGFSNGNLIGQGGDFIVYKVLQVYNFAMDNLECGELHGKTPLFKTLVCQFVPGLSICCTPSIPNCKLF